MINQQIFWYHKHTLRICMIQHTYHKQTTPMNISEYHNIIGETYWVSLHIYEYLRKCYQLKTAAVTLQVYILLFIK